MLHCNVDRLWALLAVGETSHGSRRPQVYTGEDVDGRRLNDSTWPWNGVVTLPRPDFAPGGDCQRDR